MSAASSGERTGMLERLTDSTAFAVLFACAMLVLGPFLVFGLVMLPSSLEHALQSMELDDWALSLLPVAGAVGVVGLFLSWCPPQTLAGYRIMMGCIVIGIATAITIAVLLFCVAVPGDWLLGPMGSLVLAMPILGALGRIARLWRLRAAAEGRAQDALPLIFLTVALAEAGCAIAIGAQLAFGG